MRRSGRQHCCHSFSLWVWLHPVVIYKMVMISINTSYSVNTVNMYNNFSQHHLCRKINIYFFFTDAFPVRSLRLIDKGPCKCLSYLYCRPLSPCRGSLRYSCIGKDPLSPTMDREGVLLIRCIERDSCWSTIYRKGFMLIHHVLGGIHLYPLCMKRDTFYIIHREGFSLIHHV